MCALLIIIFLLVPVYAFSIDYVYREGYGIVASWSANDAIGVYANNSTQTRFFINSVDADNPHASSGYGYGINLMNNKQYFAMSPYSADYYQNDNISTALPLAFSALTQRSNGDVGHLASQDIMVADVMTTSENQATFNFEHTGAILRLAVKVPEDGVFRKAMLSVGQDVFTSTASMNVENKTITPITTAKMVELLLDNISVRKGELLTVYFMLPAVDLSNMEITARFVTSENIAYVCGFEGFNCKAGRMYNVGRTVVESDDMDIEYRDTTPAKARIVSQNRVMERAAGVVTYPRCTLKDFILDGEDVRYDPFTQPNPIGDANGDGRVTISDYSAIVSCLMNQIPDKIVKKSADIDGDNKITEKDLDALVRILMR